MKTLLLLFAGILCMSYSGQSQVTGACEIISITTQFISSSPSTTQPGKCDVKVNISWEQAANNGNKFTYFHIWQAGSYQAFTYNNPAHAPSADDLSLTLGTIIVKDPSSINPILFNLYNPDQTYTKVLPLPGYGALTLRKTSLNNIDRFTVENVILPGAVCNANGIYRFVADVWSSQQGQGKNVHCAGRNNSFFVNELVDRSLISCGNNSMQIQLLSNTSNATGTYRVFADLGNDGNCDPSTDVAITGVENYTTGSTAVVSGNWPYQFENSTLSIPVAYNQNNFWVEVIPDGGIATQAFLLSNPCRTLPVTLSEFSASRIKNLVTMKWKTLNEQNHKGFNLERKTDGNWVTIGFIPAKAGGNSSTPVAYEFVDANSFKGISQYKLVEVSQDGKQRSSEIKAVKGESQSNKIMIYPNPSTTGTTNLVFESNSTRDIFIRDMSGRIVKQFKNVVNNNIIMENLHTGFYTIRIIDQETNESVTEKLIVNKP